VQFLAEVSSTLVYVMPDHVDFSFPLLHAKMNLIYALLEQLGLTFFFLPYQWMLPLSFHELNLSTLHRFLRIPSFRTKVPLASFNPTP
jgi:hypothetical protein